MGHPLQLAAQVHALRASSQPQHVSEDCKAEAALVCVVCSCRGFGDAQT